MERKIASELLSIGAVFLRPEEPFTWASGIKSPIYCDNRLTLSAPAVRDSVEHGLAELVKKHYPGCQMLMGTSTAGIAHAAITATILGLPMGYVRSEAKSHGRNNRIEGRMDKGTKVVVVEDLISTAGSALDVVQALREEGAEVLGHCQHLHLRDAQGTRAYRGGRHREPFPLQSRHSRGGGGGGRVYHRSTETADP